MHDETNLLFLPSFLPSKQICLAALTVGAALAFADRAAADSFICGTTEEAIESAPFVPTAGEVGALIVFARFPDDLYAPYDSSAAYGWVDPNNIPQWADSTLIECASTPSESASISMLYYEMSDGAHVVKGTVFPDLVTTSVTLDSLMAWYPPQPDSSHVAPRIGYANADVAAQVVASLGTDVFDYDLDPADGAIDQLWIYYRSVKASTWPHNRLVPWNGHGSLFFDESFPVGDTLVVVNHGTTTSSFELDLDSHYDWVDPWQVRYVFAHEYGHLFGWDHTFALGPFDFMSYTPVNVHPGHEIASGGHRLQVGWIAPDTLDCSGASVVDTTLVLKPAEVANSDAFALIETVDPIQWFLLECRAADTSFFTQAKENGKLDIAQNHSGLLITHRVSAGADDWSDKPPKFDPELATGMFASSGAPDPTDGEDERQGRVANTTWGTHEWDLFQDGTADTTWSDVFAPYTNPSSNLYERGVGGQLFGLSQDVYSGITIHNVRWANPGHDSMYVSVYYDGSEGVAPAKADTIRTNTTWSGRVQLTGDLYVEPFATLAMEGNAEVIFAPTDRFAGGLDTTRIELITPGILAVHGDSTDPVKFTSSRDDDFVHFRGPGEGGTGGEDAAAGDWYGIRDYETPTASLSTIEYAEIKYPVFGVTVDSLSCNLFGNRFSDSESGDIRVTGDVRILPNHEWRLFAPTRVVVDSLPVGLGYDSESNEIIVNGTLRTERPGGVHADSVVTFTSNSSNPSRGDWYGIEFVSDVTDSDAVASIEAAQVEWCDTPLSFMLWDSAYVGDSHVRKFVHTGVEFLYSTGTVSDCEIQGNADASAIGDGAMVGIHGVRSAPALFDNTVGWHREYGIMLEYTGVDCIYGPAVQDSILLEGNTIQGRGESNGTLDEGWGAKLLYMCDEIPVRLSDNSILDWYDGGLDLNTCLGARLECNTFQESYKGLLHTRGTLGSSNEVELRQNLFIANSNVGLESDDADYLKLYNGVLGWPKNNGFQPDSVSPGPKVPNIRNAWGSGSTLNAKKTFWKSASGDILSEADSSYVRERIANVTPGDSVYVDIRNFISALPACGEAGSGAGPIGPDSRPAEEGGGEEPIADAVQDQNVPLDWGLTVRAERDRARIRLGIPVRESGDVRVVAYDVAGRRVAVVHQIHRPVAGWREVAWPYRDGGGRKVASGVYFLRLETPDRYLTRKVVVLH